jgi:hypothetical protein
MASSKAVVEKAEEIARQLLKGRSPQSTARQMGMSYEALVRITATAEYQEIEAGVAKTLGEKAIKVGPRTRIQEEMEELIPQAFRVLQEKLEKRDLKAALEILDRDPERQLAKGRDGGQPAAPTSTGVKVHIDSKALAQAVKDANETYELVERATRNKIGEA